MTFRSIGLAPHRLVALPAVGAMLVGCAATNQRLMEPIHKSTASWELKRAEDHAQRGRDESAADAFQRAIRHDPRCAAAHAGLARLRLQQGAMDQAAGSFRSAVKYDPQRFEYAMELADCLRIGAAQHADPRAQLADAIRAYQYAESLDGTRYEPVFGIGVSYRLLGDVDRALDHLRRAIGLNPAAVAPHIEKAAAHFARNEYRNALAEYRQILEIDPNSVAAHNGAGRVNAVLARARGPRGALARERAVAHFRRSLELGTDQADIRKSLAELEMYRYPGVQVVRDEPED